jgi:hypothetical protein
MHSRRLIWRKSPKLFLISFNDPLVNNKCLVDAISICRRNQTSRKRKNKFFCLVFCFFVCFFARFRFRGSYIKVWSVKDTHSTSRARCRRQKTLHTICDETKSKACKEGKDHAKPRHNTRKVCACVYVTET